ncbi:thioredoxin family protein [Botryobacter ruber]|uniref:thioredoxin family protein n=1 Tax=Botryobacter ruber TaxID=2171629 RepID=UPI000E09E9DC|nr:DUF255 domain-containing protein [Botryobacter ruber]
MINRILLLPLLTLVFLLTGFKVQKPAAPATTALPAAEKIEWLTMEDAVAKMKQQRRKIVVDVYTDWCGWCKKMDKSTFANPKVAAYVNQHLYAVKLDAEGRKPITLNGTTYKYNPQYKAHELAVALLNGQMSFPSTVFLDEQMQIITPVPGYLDADAFSKISRYFGDNIYKTQNWQEYEKSLKKR